MRRPTRVPDATGAGQPIRETMAQRRQPVDVGRPRGAAARVAGRGPDAATRRAWAELEQISSDVEMRLRRLRLLALDAN